MRLLECSRYILRGELGGDPGAFGHLKVLIIRRATCYAAAMAEEAALEAELADREEAQVADIVAVAADSVEVARPEVGRRRIRVCGIYENIPGNGNGLLKCLRMV